MNYASRVASLLFASALFSVPLTAQAQTTGTANTYVSQTYKLGEALRDDDNYVVLDNWWEFGLPDPSGDDIYVRIGDEIFRVASATLKILEAWKAVRDQ